jgi:exopolyphosphatase/guanosine-5'-triphosphate,3'-diphosphate pyrophosphatase
VCAIDIGTNTLLALVLERTKDGALRTLADSERITGLGRGAFRTGELDRDAMDRALEALEDAARNARSLQVDHIAAVGTSAVRDARNRSVFIDRAFERTGIRIEAITGTREAALTFRGATPGIELDGPITVIDIGGGSTEIVRGQGTHIFSSHSVDVGSIRLYERHAKADPLTPNEIAALHADIDRAFDQTALIIEPPLVALAGTACTLAAIARAKEGMPNEAAVHGMRLRARELSLVTSELALMTAKERRVMPGMIAGRADVIVAGAMLLARIAVRAGAEEVITSEGGVRWGLALSMLEENEPRTG